MLRGTQCRRWKHGSFAIRIIGVTSGKERPQSPRNGGHRFQMLSDSGLSGYGIRGSTFASSRLRQILTEKSMPAAIPAVQGGRFVSSDDDGREEWTPGYFEHLLQHPDLVLAYEPPHRVFYICTQHAAARACAENGACELQVPAR